MSATARPDRLARTLATAVTPGYSRVGQTISELSAPGTPYPVIIHVTFMANGLLVLALGIAVARVLGHHLPGRLTALFLLLYGAAYLVSGLFPDDSERPLVGGVTENLVHDITAQAGVGSVMAALAAGAWAMAHGHAWRRMASLGLAALAVDVALVVPLLADWWDGYHGLFERVMFLVTLALVELLALRVRRVGAPARYHGVQTVGEVGVEQR